jgi:transposase InsO family protein
MASQYMSWVFGHRLRDAGLLGSMGRVASSVDNSMIESFGRPCELRDTYAAWETPKQSMQRSSSGSRLRTPPATTHRQERPAVARRRVLDERQTVQTGVFTPSVAILATSLPHANAQRASDLGKQADLVVPGVR